MPSDHYYTQNPQSAHKAAQVNVTYRGHALRFETDSGVFSRTELDRGTQVLLDSLPDSLSGRVLDMGCGWGVMGVAVGVHFPVSVVMTDINQRACDLARRNAQANGVPARVLQSDGYAALQGEAFDWILQNPPIRAGKAVIYQMFADGARSLQPGGSLWLVIRKQQGAPSAIQYLSTLFAQVETVEKKSGFWVIRCMEPLSA